MIDPATGLDDGQEADPTGLGVPPQDPNAPPIDVGQAVTNFVAPVAQLYNTSQTPYELAHPEEAASPAAPAPEAPAAPVAPPAPAAPAPPPAAPPPTKPGAPGPTELKSTTTSVRQKVMSPEERAALGERERLQGERLDQTGKEADAGKRDAQQRLEATQETNAQLAQAEQEAAAQKAKQEQTVQRLSDYAATKSKEYADGKIQNFWASKSNGAKFLAVLLSGIGGMAARATGGRNPVLEELDHLVEDDFRQQRERLVHSKDIADLARQDAGAADQKLRYMDYELRVKKLGVLEKAGRLREEELARNGVGDADMQKDAKLLAVRELYNRESQLLTKDFRKEVDVSTVRAPAQPGAGPDPKSVVMGPGGRPLGVAINEQQAKTASTAVEGYTRMARAGERLRTLIKQHGTEAYGPIAGEMESLQADMVFGLKQMDQAGALDEGMVQQASKLIPNSAGWSNSLQSRANMLAKLSTTMRSIRQRTATALDGAGLKGGDRVSDIDRMIYGQAR